MILTIENTHQLPYPIPKKGMELEWMLYGRCFKEIHIVTLENKVYLKRKYKNTIDFFALSLDDWYKGLLILDRFYLSFTNKSENDFIAWLEQYQIGNRIVNDNID